MVKTFHEKVRIKTERRTQLVDITSEVEAALGKSGCAKGMCTVYVPHTTAGVIINEGDDPAVARDIEATLDRLAPRSAKYEHAEGNSDAHIKTALTASSAMVMIEDGKLLLGRWQGIFFCEFDGPRDREVWLKISPDVAG
jgi:secondary thiamine-phosphate synthase enzyme